MTARKTSLPFDRVTGDEFPPSGQPGYYPGFRTLNQQKYWDKTTRRTVLSRVTETMPIRFFSEEEARLMDAVIARILPQGDRLPEKYISLLPVIDERLYKNSLNGFRYEDMPPDRDAYRQGLRAIDEMARQRFQAAFPDLTVHRQELILKSLHDGKPEPEHALWKELPVHRFWALLMEDCVTAYYSHPWAWDEIGFGGPAYPRGYMRLENGLPEPWESNEVRYEWNAPIDSVSELERDSEPPPPGSTHGSAHVSIHGSAHGHGGTH